jgi:hypothetical protein
MTEKALFPTVRHAVEALKQECGYEHETVVNELVYWLENHAPEIERQRVIEHLERVHATPEMHPEH